VREPGDEKHPILVRVLSPSLYASAFSGYGSDAAFDVPMRAAAAMRSESIDFIMALSLAVACGLVLGQIGGRKNRFVCYLV